MRAGHSLLDSAIVSGVLIQLTYFRTSFSVLTEIRISIAICLHDSFRVSACKAHRLGSYHCKPIFCGTG